jgi:catechol 2,3-dioxygenase-like lactoylglutathione lyase family enzyme
MAKQPLVTRGFYDKIPKSTSERNAMINGVQYIHYNVSDVTQAIRFYTEALQMKLLSKDDWWVALDCNGVQVGLHPTRAEENVFEVPRDSHGAHGQATLALRSDNIPEDRKRIEKYGGVILGETNASWGHRLVFTDLDGNVLKLYTQKPNNL